MSRRNETSCSPNLNRDGYRNCWGMASRVKQDLKINILLKNNDDLIFNCDLDINESKSIDSIFEEVCNSDLKLESCLSETKTLVISLKHSSDVKTYICLLRELDSNSFQLGVKVATKHSILKKKLIISKIIDLISNASKNFEQSKVSNISSVTNSQSQLANYNESKSKDLLETKDTLLRCHKCQANLASLNQERKLEGYLLPIIRSDGKNAYICDLCGRLVISYFLH